MPIAEAYRRCPDAVFLRPDMTRYARVSRDIFKILETISPVVEPVSVDEAYLDLTGLERLIGPPAQIGREIKTRILAGTGLRVSVGIGPNRLIAKLASEAGKPDGLMVVQPEQVPDFLAPMPVANLRGVGRQTTKIFTRLGIRTVAQLRTIPLRYLEEPLGRRAAASLHEQALGIASSEVVPGRQRKSISRETTFEQDVQEKDVLHDVLRVLAAEVAATARRDQLFGSVVTLKVRFAGFDTHTRQHRLAQPTHDERVIRRAAWRLLTEGDLPDRPVRLIGVGISQWCQPDARQRELFGESRTQEKTERLLQTIDRASERFGKGILALGQVPKSGRNRGE
jgi:DNA polymerase-4